MKRFENKKCDWKSFQPCFLIFYNSVEYYEDNGKEKDLDEIINKEEDFLDVEDAKGGLISGGIFDLVPMFSLLYLSHYNL